MLQDRGNPAVYSGFSLIQIDTGGFIQQDYQYVPDLVDLDRDGLVDIVLGKRDGTLSYYRNTGLQNGTMFSWVTDTLGGINVVINGNQGYAIPEFVDIDTVYHLVVGSESGQLFYYDSIDNNLNGTFNLVDQTLDNIDLGRFSAPAIADLDGDNKLEMVLGNILGGLGLYESDIVSNIGIEEQFQAALQIYPNPAEALFYIELFTNGVNNSSSDFEIFDMMGKRVMSGVFNGNKTQVDCNNLSKGVYLLNLNCQGHNLTKKLILE